MYQQEGEQQIVLSSGLAGRCTKHKRTRFSKPTFCNDAGSTQAHGEESHELYNVRAQPTAWHDGMAKALAPLGSQSDDHANSSVMLTISCKLTNRSTGQDCQSVHLACGVKQTPAGCWPRANACAALFTAALGSWSLACPMSCGCWSPLDATGEPAI